MLHGIVKGRLYECTYKVNASWGCDSIVSGERLSVCYGGSVCFGERLGSFVEDEMDGKLVRSDPALSQKVRNKAETVAFVLVTQVLMIVYHVVRRMQGKFDFLRDRRTLDKR